MSDFAGNMTGRHESRHGKKWLNGAQMGCNSAQNGYETEGKKAGKRAGKDIGVSPEPINYKD